MRQFLKYVLPILVIVVLGAGGYAYWNSKHSEGSMAMNMGSTGYKAQTAELNMGSTDPKAIPVTKLVAPTTNAPVKTFNLTAQVANVKLDGKVVKEWIFYGCVPGDELRLTIGDKVVVLLSNKLNVGVTIHWHGVNVPGAMDGIAGVTQNQIKPGQTFTYSFIADQAGTYWYHSHQDSSNEVAKGLYGVLVVEPKQQTQQYDHDYSVAFHEWNTTGSTDEGMSGMNMGNMNGMNMNRGSDNSSMGNMKMGSSNDSSTNSMDMSGPVMMPNNTQITALSEMMSMYDVFTANGTSNGLHLDAKPEETVRLRLVNTGNMTHLFGVSGVSYKVIALDGHDITNPTPLTTTVLPIGAAQRYDISFTMPKDHAVSIVNLDSSSKMNKMMTVTIGNGTVPNTQFSKDMWFDFSKYGSNSSDTSNQITMNSKFTKEYDMKLGSAMKKVDGQEQMVYTINGKSFPDVPPIKVEKGDLVKVHFVNNSNAIHPMHLHGHTFQVLTRNGKALTGSPVYMDTINVLPGESYDIAFKANNPGLWMFHCHDLHHAAAGMDTMVDYKGISTPFTIGKQSGNNPE
jgi:FtsP/CotA-like multicopper oxidase with cupredoxin domain